MTSAQTKRFPHNYSLVHWKMVMVWALNQINNLMHHWKCIETANKLKIFNYDQSLNISKNNFMHYDIIYNNIIFLECLICAEFLKNAILTHCRYGIYIMYMPCLLRVSLYIAPMHKWLYKYWITKKLFTSWQHNPATWKSVVSQGWVTQVHSHVLTHWAAGSPHSLRTCT